METCIIGNKRKKVVGRKKRLLWKKGYIYRRDCSNKTIAPSANKFGKFDQFYDITKPFFLYQRLRAPFGETTQGCRFEFWCTFPCNRDITGEIFFLSVPVLCETIDCFRRLLGIFFFRTFMRNWWLLTLIVLKLQLVIWFLGQTHRVFHINWST